MPPLVIPNALQVVCSGTILGQPWANVFGVIVPGLFVLDQASATQIAEDFSGPYSLLAATLNDSWTMDEVKVTDIRTEGGPSFIGEVDNVAGTSTTDPLPSNLSLVVTHRTALNTRRGRGRTYLAGWHAGHLTALGNASASAVNAANAFAAGVRGALEDDDCQLAIISRVDDTARAVVNSSTDGKWDHQDRRK